MKHTKQVSRTPELAQSGLCTDIVGNTQATKCLFLEVLTNFALPVIEAKNGVTPLPVPDDTV
jgi:hypothetical protein